MKFKPVLFLVFLLALSAIQFAQKAEPAKTQPVKPEGSTSTPVPTVRQILDRYVKALGGREAVEKLKSRTAKGTVELVPMNLSGTFETYAAPEAKSHTRMVLNGIGELIETTDGKAAWSVNPIQGSRERSGAELAQAKLTNDFYRDIRLDKLFPKIETKGVEKVGDKDAYVLVATAPDLPSETWYFDMKSGILLRSDVTTISPEGPQPMSIYYEDMRAVDGVSLPFRVRTKTPQFEIIINFTEIKHGAPIDEAKFAKPKQ